MKALITGGAGFIGSHLADRLLKEKWQVVIIDNLSTGQQKNIPASASFYKKDISNFETIQPIFAGVDYVFHLASIARTQYCVEHPLECNEANITGTLNVLEASRRANIKKIIHSSSSAIYPNNKTPYAVQKRTQEDYMKLYSQIYNLPSICLRYFNVYGTKRQSEKGAYPNVLAAFSKQRRENNKVYITGDGKQTRDFVHVFDVVKANILAASSNLGNGEAIDICTGKPTSINQIADFFLCEKVYIAPRPGECRDLCGNPDKAKKLIGWEPKITLREGIKIYFGGQK